MEVYGIIRGNTVLIENENLEPYEGDRVVVTLPDHGKRERLDAFRQLDALRQEVRWYFAGAGTDDRRELIEALEEKYGRTD